MNLVYTKEHENGKKTWGGGDGNGEGDRRGQTRVYTEYFVHMYDIVKEQHSSVRKVDAAQSRRAVKQTKTANHNAEYQ